MFIKDVIETEDASFYSDWLCEVTGKSRREWNGISTEKLRSLCLEFRRKERNEKLNISVL